MPDTHIRILIVDDEPSIRISMSRLLTELGYHARSAAEGFSALREIREEMPDILLTDLNMPGTVSYTHLLKFAEGDGQPGQRDIALGPRIAQPLGFRSQVRSHLRQQIRFAELESFA